MLNTILLLLYRLMSKIIEHIARLVSYYYRTTIYNSLIYTHLIYTGLQYNEGPIIAASQQPASHGVLYENVDSLSQSTVKTTQLYENIPTVSLSHHQNNIEMNQCTAYGVLKRTV